MCPRQLVPCLALLAAAACSLDLASKDRCRAVADCQPGSACVEGRCLSGLPAGPVPDAAPGDAPPGDIATDLPPAEVPIDAAANPAADAGPEGAPDVAPAPPRIRQVSAGREHSCALRGDGTVGCWGMDSVAIPAPAEARFRQIAAGDHFTCGLELAGTIRCWGM